MEKEIKDNTTTPIQSQSESPAEEMSQAYGFGETRDNRRFPISIIGLILSIAAWVAVFASGAIKSVIGLKIQLWITMAIAIASVVLCWLGRKREGFLSMIGLIIGGSLILFVVIGLIGTAFI